MSLTLMRLLALVFMLICGLLFIAGLFVYQAHSAAYPERYSAFSWSPFEMDQIFSRVGLSFNWWLQFNLISSILFAVVQCGVGLFIFYRKREDWFGIYIAMSFVLFGTQTGFPTTALHAMYPALEAVLMPLGVLAWMAIFLIFYAFPDGRFRPSWTRWAAAGLVGSYVIDILFFAGETPPIPLLLFIFLLIGVGVGSQVYRYRFLSTPMQRQQTKWVMLALLIIFAALIFTMVPFLTTEKIDPSSPMALALVMMSSMSFLLIGLIPLSIAFAILRYRLWDLDLIIRRTLVYAGLTASLGLVYFGGVVLLETLLRPLAGGESQLAIILTTLAIAALVSPLRRCIQDFIDKRFYRQKYNAEQALAEFASLASQETDLRALTDKLVDVVRETVQPVEVSLWLRGNKRLVENGLDR
jgi:hypothetical protein